MSEKHEMTKGTGRKPANEKQGVGSRIKAAYASAVAFLRKQNPTVLLAGSLVLVLVLVGVTMLAFTGGSSDEPLANESQEEVEPIEETASLGAVVTYSEGTLQTQNEEGFWEDVEGELQPVEGTNLRTVGAASRSIVTFDDGSALRLDANSEVEFTHLTVERIEITHVNGYTYSRVLPSESRTYVVSSQDAQYEALGTAFKTAATGDEQSVEVYHSSVQETTTNQTPKEGEKLIVKSAVSPGDDGTIEPIDIEAVKQDKFMTWNKSLDEQDENFKESLGYLKDFDAPDLNITSHSDGQVVLLDADADVATISFTGNTERRSTVTVQSKSLAGSAPVNVPVGDDGAFTTPVLEAPFGEAVFTFEVKDRVGNTGTKTVRVTLQRKSAPVSAGGIVASVELTNSDEKVKVSWGFTGGLSAPDGVKVLASQSSGPTYPGDSIGLKESGSSLTKKIDGNFDSGEKYYFRVCKYDADNNDCSVYSDQVSLTIP